MHVDYALNDLWYVLYLVLVVAVFWTLWRFIQLTNLSVSQRRALFILCGTILFTPVLLPVAAVGSGIVPSGTIFLLVLSQGVRELLGSDWDIFLLIASCTGITSVGLSLIAGQLIQGSATKAQWNWTYPGYAGGMLAVAAAIVVSTVPSYEIAGRITESRLEEVYGASFDASEALQDVADPEKRQEERFRLRYLFKTDPSIVGVTVRQRRTNEFDPIYLRRNSIHVVSFCLSSKNIGSKCIGPSYEFEKRETLRYTRRDSQNRVSVVVVFDYNSLLSRL